MNELYFYQKNRGKSNEAKFKSRNGLMMIPQEEFGELMHMGNMPNLKR